MKHNVFASRSHWLATLAGVLSLQTVSAWADTTLTFDERPSGQGHNAAVNATFGDNAVSSSPGVLVDGTGTPDIDLNFGGAGGAGRWDYYIDSVWSVAQLDNATVDKSFDITFTPTAETGVALKSFNLHPYYQTQTTYDFNWSVTDLDGNVLKDGLVRALSDGTKTPVDVSFTGELGQTLVLRLLRVASQDETPNEGRADSIALDDLRFAQIPEIPPLPVGVITRPTTLNPVSPEIVFQGLIADGIRKAVPSSIELLLDGQKVNAQVSTAAGKHQVTYSNPNSFYASGSQHVYELIFSDDGTPAARYTNSVTFTTLEYSTINLPAAFAFEDFDQNAEGALPAGWTTRAYIPGTGIEGDLQDLNSPFYEAWTTVNRSRFTQSMLSYDNHVATTDYQRVLTPPPAVLVGGSLVTQLGSGQMIFNTSGYRSGSGQYSEVISPDFDCSNKTGVTLAFHSLWEQNQDSIAAMEYSIDEGVSWIPIAYFLERGDVLPGGEEPTDPVATLTTTRNDTAKFTDPDLGEERGSAYIDFIKSPLDSISGDQIHPRADDNAASSKRIEIFTLAQADNQPKVRLRFAHAGTDSWYWGIDNVGLYSLNAAPRLSITRNAGNVTVTWTGDGTLQSSPSITGPWENVPEAQVNNRSFTTGINASAQFFRLQ